MLDNDKIDAIRRLSEANLDFIEFFRVLALRQRNQKETDVDVLVKGTNENIGPEYERRRLVRIFFKELEKVGIGTLRIGRRGKPTRFIWKTGMLEVVRTVGTDEGGSNTIENLQSDEESKPRILAHRYNLRENYVVNIDLPVNLTEIEAERLSAFIKSLPLKNNLKEKHNEL